MVNYLLHLPNDFEPSSICFRQGEVIETNCTSMKQFYLIDTNCTSMKQFYLIDTNCTSMKQFYLIETNCTSMKQFYCDKLHCICSDIVQTHLLKGVLQLYCYMETSDLL